MLTLNAALQPHLENGDITLAEGYAEPGYRDPDKGVLFANWNDKTLGRLGELAERAGYAIEWSDEWTTCSGCWKAVRTSPDSYSWTPSFHDADGEVYCIDCIDPEGYFEDLSGEAHKAALPGFPHPEDHGYVLLKDDMAHGWHPGQNDSPEVLARELRQRGVDDFVFRIDGKGQFDVHFSVYVRPEDRERLAVPPPSALPYDPGTELGKALRGEHSDVYTVTSRTLTAEEFVSGKWK